MSRFTEELRGELLAAAEREVTARQAPDRRRPVRWWRALVTAVVAAVGALGWAVFGPSPASAGVEVELVDGRLEVRLVDIEYRAAVIEEAIDEAGVDAQIDAVPVSPSIVGRFVGQTEVPGLVRLDGDPTAFSSFSIPAGYDGTLRLFVGRPAEPGEAYVAGGIAYDPGEPLSCLGMFGSTGTEAAAIAERAGVEVRFQPFVPVTPDVPTQGEGLPTLRGNDVAVSPYADWLAADAVTVAPDEVLVYLTPDGSLAVSDRDPGELGRCRE